MKASVGFRSVSATKRQDGAVLSFQNPGVELPQPFVDTPGSLKYNRTMRTVIWRMMRYNNC